MKRFIPSKTFITGEYSVLIGGASLTVATEPCFEVTLLDRDNEFRFHPDSPAGLSQKMNPDSGFIHFLDPYINRNVKGGFGKSTAEYLATRTKDLLKIKLTPQALRAEYLSLFAQQAVKPSGVDLVTQYLGGWVLSDVEKNQFSQVKCRFPDLEWVLISTGLKIQTHEHLATLNLKSIENLPVVSDQVIDCFLNKSMEDFLLAMNEWAQILKQLKLTHPQVFDFMSRIQSNIPDMQVLKPCGALGADVVVGFFPAAQKDHVMNQLRTLKINVQATSAQISKGFINELG